MPIETYKQHALNFDCFVAEICKDADFAMIQKSLDTLFPCHCKYTNFCYNVVLYEYCHLTLTSMLQYLVDSNVPHSISFYHCMGYHHQHHNHLHHHHIHQYHHHVTSSSSSSSYSSSISSSRYIIIITIIYTTATNYATATT